MSEVDERVVQMKFDNAQFEAGVQQTLQSLNKLNKSIDENTKSNNGKSLTGLTNAVNSMSSDFNKLDKTADVVSKKFSVFGTIGDQVLRRIADGAVNTTKKLISMVNSPLEQIKSGGWSRATNINNARFQLNGLKIAWDSVNKDLQYAVNQTAYGLDSAANVASQLAASGITIRDNIQLTADNVDELAQKFKGMSAKTLIANGSLDEMSVALRAISGVAAQTNSSYDDIGNVFARVAGQGRVMATDLNSLAARGMNAAATLGQALGKSESEVRDMVSKGQISFEIFSEAMYDAFADHAIDANNTFSGALANMKAALSKIGAEFFLPFLERVPKLFNAIRESINDLKSDLMPFIKDLNGITAKLIDTATDLVYSFKKSGMITDIVSSMREAFFSLLLILHPIKDAFAAVFNNVGFSNFKGITSAIYSLIKALHLSVNQMNVLYKVSYAIFTVIKVIGKTVTTVVGGALRLVKPVFNLLSAVFSLITSILRAITGSASNTELADNFGKLSRSAKDLYLSGIDKIAGFINAIADAIRKINLSPFILKVKEVGSAFGNWVINLPIVNKLASKLSKVTKGSTSVFQGITKILSTLTKKIKDIVTSVKSLPAVKRIITDLSKAFTVLGSIAVVALMKVISGIEKVVGIVKSFNLGTINEWLNKIAAALEDIWNRFTGLFTSIKSGSSAIDALKENFGDLMERIVTVKDKVVDFFKTFIKSGDGEKAKASIETLMSTLLKFAKNITPAKVAALALSALFVAMAVNITKVSSALSNTLTGVNGIFKSLSSTISSFKKKKSNKIIELAESIGILAASLYLISKIDKDRLKASVEAIGVLAIVLAGLMAVSTLLAKALNKLNGDSKGLNTIGISVLAMSSSFLILAGALKVLDGIELSVDLVGKLAIVELAVTGLAAIAMACAMVKTKSVKTALTVVALAGATWVIANSIEKLSGIQLEGAIKSIGILGVAIGILAVISNVMGKVGIFSTIGIILAAVTINKIAPMLDNLTKYDFSKITKKIKENKETVIILGGLITAMGIIGKLCGKGFGAFGAGMILISLSIALMVGVVKKLGEMDAAAVAKGTKALTKFVGLVAILEVLSFATGKSRMLSFSASLLVISAALLIMTGITAILGSLDPLMVNNGIKALAGLVSLIALLEICGGIAAKAKGSISSTIALILSISVLTGELIVLSFIPAKDLIAPLVAIGSIITMLCAVFKSMAKLNETPVNIGAIIEVATVLGAVVTVCTTLLLLANKPWSNMISAAAGIALVMASMSGMMLAIKGLGSAKVSLGTIVALAGALVSMIVIANVLSKLAAYDWKSMLAAGVSISAVLLSLSVAASIISLIPTAGALSGAKSLLIIVGVITAIVAILGGLYQIDRFNKVLSDGGKSLLLIGQAIGNFVGGIIGGIAEGVTSVLPKIADDLSAFALGIQPFCILMGSIDSSVLEGTATFAKAILAISGSEFVSGILDVLKSFTGSNDIDVFAQKLTAFGLAIVQYADTVSVLDDGMVEKISLSADAASSLIKVADAIPNSGGLLGKIVGNNDLDDFAATLIPFGEGLVNYGQVVSLLTEQMVSSISLSADATKAIIEVADAIPNSGGLLGKIVGNNDLDDFGNTLVPFAEGLVNFGQTSSLLTKDMVKSIDNVVDATSKLIKLANSLENMGGIGSWFTGDNTLSKFGDTLKDFAASLGTFANQYKNIDVAAINDVDKLISKLVTAANEAATVNADSFNGLKEALKSVASDSVSSFIAEFSGSEERVKNAIKQLLIKSADSASNSGTKKKFKDLGSELADSMADGFSSSLSFSNAVKLLVNGAINSVKQSISKFKEAGAMAGQAVIDGYGGDKGIDDYPESEKAHKITDLVAAGAENSVNDNKSKYNKSGASAGQMVIDGMSGAINKGKDYLGGLINDVYGSAVDQYNALYGDLSLYGSDSTSSSGSSATGASTAATEANTAAKTANAKASTSAAKATKTLSEEEKVLAKFTKNSALTMEQYMNSVANALDIIGDTTPEDAAKAAINELAEAIYTASQETDDSVSDTSDSAKDHAQEVMKAFNEAFESVKSSTKGALDYFSSFDKKFSEKIKPKEMIANFKSQEEGITDFYSNLGILSAKGFCMGFVKSLMEEGPSAYGKVSGLLDATSDEIAQLNEQWNSKESIANKSAAMAMTALMTSMQITKLRDVDAQRKKSVTAANDALKSYKEKIKEAQDAGLDMEETLKMVQDQAVETGETMEESGPSADLITSYNDLQKAMLDAGLSNEDLQKAMLNDDGFEFTENATLKIIDRINELSVVVQKFKDVGSELHDTVKSQISSSVSYFDEWNDKYEMTGEKMLENLRSNIAGLAQYNQNIQTIIKNGGQELVNLLGDKLTPEYANAIAQMNASMLEETINGIKTLNAAPEAYANQAQQTWYQYGQISGMGLSDALTQLSQNQTLLAQGSAIGQNVGQGAVQGMQQTQSAVATAGQAVGQAAIDGVATGAQTHSPSVATTTMGQNIDQGLINGVRALSQDVVGACRTVGVQAINGMQSGVISAKTGLMTTVRSLINQVVTTFKNGLAASVFQPIGQQICNGLVAGIQAGQSDVINAAVETATSAYEAACEALDINSPSRKMRWVGLMYDSGMAGGIEDGSDSITDAATQTMQSALQTAVDLMNSTGDMNPTIKPVLDLSDVQNGSRLLSSAFDSIGPMNVGANIGKITTPTDRVNSMLSGMKTGSNTYGDTNLYVYGAQGQDVNQLAKIVIKKLDNEYARRKAAWT